MLSRKPLLMPHVACSLCSSGGLVQERACHACQSCRERTVVPCICGIGHNSTAHACLQVRQAITAHQQAVKLAGQGALRAAVTTSQAAREVSPKLPSPV